MMKRNGVAVCLCCIGLLATSVLHADEAGEARLRDQLRQTMLEARRLQDENSELQVKLSGAQSAPAPKAENAHAARAEIEKVRGAMKQEMAKVQADLDDTRRQLAAAQQALTESARQVGVKSSALQEVEGRVSAAKSRIENCEKDNRVLAGISGDLLQRYHDMSVWEALLDREPLTGLARVRRENIVEKYRGGIIDATLDVPPAATTDEAPAAAAAPAMSAADQDAAVAAARSSGRAVVFVGGRPHGCRNNSGRVVCEPLDVPKRAPATEPESIRVPQASR